ncbi:hypothetical protein QAD02_020323 [Eretmocerus hayati]|uniref:Uncharacterized protein n=1 Tax=Eretmocerus hayati TaxID=131215 RepID=A0ACC2PM21_9HYME|nr:hypothetical protein QAD02_020323 [Eretmocerus hayati]
MSEQQVETQQEKIDLNSNYVYHLLRSSPQGTSSLNAHEHDKRMKEEHILAELAARKQPNSQGESTSDGGKNDDSSLSGCTSVFESLKEAIRVDDDLREKWPEALHDRKELFSTSTFDHIATLPIYTKPEGLTLDDHENLEKYEPLLLAEEETLRAQYAKYELPVGPHLVACGNITKIRCTNVIFGNIRHRIDGPYSPMVAVDLCFKSALVFSEKFCKAATLIWKFIEHCGFGMPNASPLSVSKLILAIDDRKSLYERFHQGLGRASA